MGESWIVAQNPTRYHPGHSKKTILSKAFNGQIKALTKECALLQKMRSDSNFSNRIKPDHQEIQSRPPSFSMETTGYES